MFLVSLYRIIKFSLQDITRNIWLSLITIIILVLALFSINMLLVVKVVGSAAVNAVKNKVDVSIYLKPDASEKDINNLKAQVSGLSGVKEVTYISKDDALEIFKTQNNDNPEVLEALRELGKNPLTPSLVITPSDIDSTASLINDLNKIQSDTIDSKNFTDHKALLEKINAITDRVTKAGLALAIIFILITLMVIFNSSRVAIYTHNTEISIMRLVGASDPFIYWPFLFSGLFYAMAGVVFVILVFYPFLSLLQPCLEAFFVGYNINIINYFNDHFLLIFGLEFLGIALINILAAWWAARRYAQV